MHEIPRNSDRARRLTQVRYADLDAREAIAIFWGEKIDQTRVIGEPISQSSELDTEGNMVFQASLDNPRRNSQKSKTGDIAKKRKVVIKTLLEHPEIFQNPTENGIGGFINRNLDRILKFAKTLKHKGKLNPQMEEILEIE